ncbi:hypothetical protein [Pantoea vagans]|uniref:hypothetical protein n=1 Tax=Pantoea vagans TaxID=470934 RepID=UPI00241F9274|nr:hypothetical protein [Pantoea vagans]
MSTENKTVGTSWTLIASDADSMLITAVAGYGDICKSTGVPSESLLGHPIFAGGERNNSYTATGEIYGRAAAGSSQMRLALTP